MKISFGARPWIYLYSGPFIGYILMILYSIFYSILEGSFRLLDVGELFIGIFVFIFIAYVIGALPALITGLITDLFSKLLSNYFNKTINRLIIPALIGFLVTISLLILFSYHTNEMDELSKVDPLSIIAISIYGAIASAICESIYSKLGSPSRIE